MPLGDNGVETLVDGIIARYVKSKGDNTTPEQMTAVKEAAHSVVSDVIKDVLTSSSVASTQSEASDGTKQLINKMEEQEAARSSEGHGLALRQLDLGDSDVTDAGMTSIAKLVAANTGITKLDLSGNRNVGTSGWRDLAHALKTNTEILTLSLDYNKLGDDDLSVLIEGLRENKTLQSLDLESNKITDDGAAMILDLLSVNTTLCDVTLMPGNKVSDNVISVVKKVLDQRSPVSS